MVHFQSKQVLLSNIIEETIQTGFQVREQARFVPLCLPAPRKVRLPESVGHKSLSFLPSSQQSKHYKLVQVKDAKPGVLYRVDPAGLDSIVVPARKSKFMQKYLIQKDDVLYLSKLRPGAFRYTGPVEDTIPMAHFYILRPKTHVVDPDYLCWALNQDFIVRHYVRKNLTGTALPFIPRSALLEFSIPLPALSIQKNIVQLLTLRAREKAIQEKIDQKKQTLISATLRKLL